MVRIRGALTAEQYEVREIKDFQELKQQAGLLIPKAVILEYGPGDSPGARILQAVRNDPELNPCPVIAYSYSGYEQLEVESLKAGADKYLSAPARYEIFVEALRELKTRGLKQPVDQTADE